MKSIKGLLILFLLLTGLIYYNSCDETVTNQIIAQLVTHGWIVGDSLDGYGYILRTTDAGETWTRQGDSSMLANISLSDLAVIDKQTVWIVGTQGTVLLTTDGGSNWQKQTTPPNDLTENLSSISAIDRNIAWISGGSLVLHTVNGGSTWNRVTISGAPTGVNLQGICAADENNIWTAGQGPLGSEGYIYYSSDAGISWNRIIPSVMPPDSAGWIGVKAISVNDIWVHGGVGKLIHTTDKGQTWIQLPKPTELNSGQIPATCWDIEFDPQNTQVIYTRLYSGQEVPWYNDKNALNKTKGTFFTTDGGDNWGKLSIGSFTDMLVDGFSQLTSASNPPIRSSRIFMTGGGGSNIKRDRKSTRLNSSHIPLSRMPSSA